MSIHRPKPEFATSRPFPSPASLPFAEPVPTRIAVLTRLDQVDAIEADWRALERAAARPTGFQSFEWCRAWMRAEEASHERRWRILCVWSGAELAALWPMQRERFLGARILSWMGEPWTQYGDALAAAGPACFPALAAAWREICAWADVDLIKLGHVRADAVLHNLPGFTGRTACNPQTAPCVDLKDVAPRPAEADLRRRRRRLEACGPVRFEIVADPSQRLDAIGQAIALKRAWLHARSLPSSGFSHSNVDRLFGELAQTEALIVARLSVAGETAALELALPAGASLRSLLGCHDPRFSRGSPGHLLISHMIGWARANGFDAYDLMLPADPYKNDWASADVAVADHLVPRTLHGRVAARYFRARPRLKEAYARLPEPLRSAISSIRTA